MPENKLYYGDNLDILRDRDYFPDECVDLIYLDPPFNSSRSLQRAVQGRERQSERRPDHRLRGYLALGRCRRAHLRRTGRSNAPYRVSEAINAMRVIIGDNQMLAYLVMMTARLVELHRVLKPTGSLYLHCDPTASHYLKIILDTIFGAENFKNEIIWKRSHAHNSAHTKWGAVMM